jgi:signal transduction histidine kinase
VPAYIESIFLNLTTNAIKYRDPEKEPTLTIQSYIEDQFIVLSVEDNGKGIDLERYGNKIFGMYKTFHGNKDARGIGLFITKNQIESMGGTIEVESEVGVGTKFRVKLLKS